MEIKGFIAKDITDLIIDEIFTECFMTIKLLVDDGTGVIPSIFTGPQAEKLIRKKTAEVVELKEKQELDIFLGKISSDLLGKNIIIKGLVKFNKSTLQYEITVAEFKYINLDDELDKAMKSIEL